jgi:hypothetical protein
MRLIKATDLASKSPTTVFVQPARQIFKMLQSPAARTTAVFKGRQHDSQIQQTNECD